MQQNEIKTAREARAKFIEEAYKNIESGHHGGGDFSYTRDQLQLFNFWAGCIAEQLAGIRDEVSRAADTIAREADASRLGRMRGSVSG